MSKFNILYWNTHYTAGYKGARKENIDNYRYLLLDASIIVKYLLEEAIKKHSNNIDGIVITEAYPQKDNDVYNELVKNSLEKKGYDVFQSYETENKDSFDRDLIIKDNGILIATKSDKGFKIRDAKHSYDKEKKIGASYLLLENDNLFLEGIRNYGDLNVIKKSIPEKKTILIGDFNMQYDDIVSDDYFKDKVFKCKDATNFDNSYIDHLLLNKCSLSNEHDFYREFLMEEEYYKLRRPDVVYKTIPNTGVAFTPYPDHNLLFASVEV